jgi:hypothetical protein
MESTTGRSMPLVVCDMSSAPDTPAERLDEYRRLFTQSLLGRERTRAGIRFRFRADPGVEAWVRDLAAREKACCAFFDFAVTVKDDEVWWAAQVIDDELARQILEEFYRLPETAGDGVDVVHQAFADRGLQVLNAIDRRDERP